MIESFDSKPKEKRSRRNFRPEVFTSRKYNADPNSFGTFLRNIRVDRGFLNASSFANFIGVSRHTLLNLEHNRTLPSQQTLEKLTEALDFTPDKPNELIIKAGNGRVFF